MKTINDNVLLTALQTIVKRFPPSCFVVGDIATQAIAEYNATYEGVFIYVSDELFGEVKRTLWRAKQALKQSVPNNSAELWAREFHVDAINSIRAVEIVLDKLVPPVKFDSTPEPFVEDYPQDCGDTLEEHMEKECDSTKFI